MVRISLYQRILSHRTRGCSLITERFNKVIIRWINHLFLLENFNSSINPSYFSVKIKRVIVLD